MLQRPELGRPAEDPGFRRVRRLWLIAIACAIGAAWQAKYHRLAALIMVSVCGLMTCITFVWFSAPDLALTQLVVEVVTTVLILLGLRWLPRRIEGYRRCRAAWSARLRRLRDLLLAVLVGGGMACCPTPC
jgi:multicomponent K+:H+ antiporter subunit A